MSTPKSYRIVVTDRAALDQNLRAVWNGMKSALAAGDKARAMQYLDASAQQRYGTVFDVLLPSMPQITATFSDLQSVTLSNDLGEYAVNRVINGENRIYLIYFGRNGTASGGWDQVGELTSMHIRNRNSPRWQSPRWP